MTTKGDLLVATGNGAIARQAVGVNGKVLTADSTQGNGVAWSDPTPIWVPGMEGAPSMAGAVTRHVKAVGITNANKTVYTCPAGYVAILSLAYFYNNSGTAGTLVAYAGAAVSAATQWRAGLAVAGFAAGSLGIPPPLAAGDSLVINATTAGTAVNVMLRVVEFPVASGLQVIKGALIANQVVTAYTTPANKVARGFYAANMAQWGWAFATATLNVTTFVAFSGSTNDPVAQVANQAANTPATLVPLPLQLDAGDSIGLQGNVAGNFWLLLQET